MKIRYMLALAVLIAGTVLWFVQAVSANMASRLVGGQ